ncbi:hypothetical protein AQUCO_05300099v1 [Aquilegia coerulea]|uniref:F-box domain-containing protein n=1 Tax=Aquilegia coerulea TaxID=218851 RepID=A0A2G5CIB2_AQUCA|nr:hypothetical protein AQUCO_05300099v1 [Aquilegia coerulea]
MYHYQNLPPDHARKRGKINVELPQEILIDIFLRLSIKSLLGCKSVCKYWLQIVTSNHFVQLHLQLANENNPRIIFTANSEPGIIDLYSLEYEKTGNVTINYNLLLSCKLNIVGSCNGLVCLSDYLTFMMICNPSTKECIPELFVMLEPLPADYKRKVVLGFGYDPLTNIYKVVRVDISYCTRADASIDAGECIFHVYTLGTREWRRIDETPGRLSSEANVAFVNGALHWFMLSDKSRWGDNSPEFSSIISLDVGKEKFQNIPAKLFHNKECHRLGVLQGCLCTFVSRIKKNVQDCIDIWMMKEYGVEESWTKQFSVTNGIKLPRYIEPFLVQRNGGVLLKSTIRNDSKPKKFLYACEPTGNKLNIYNTIEWINANTYVESLVKLPEFARSMKTSKRMVVELPQKVLINIFLRLSNNLLLCCKCVCKQWLQIVTSPHFVQLHLHRANESNPRIIFTVQSEPGIINLYSSEYEKTGNVAINYNLSLPSPIYIVGSCNGIVCLSDYRSFMVLCNPFTEECIPEVFGVLEPLLADYTRRFTMGFGYDPLTNTYKVVRIDISYSSHVDTTPADSGEYKCHVYTLGTGIWRRLDGTPSGFFCAQNVVYVNGALHWAIVNNTSRWSDNTMLPSSIMCFDIGKEKFQILPGTFFPKNVQIRLGVLQGCFCLYGIRSSEERGVEHIDVWMMKEYGVEESWTKQFSIDYAMKPHRDFIDPLVVLRNGEILLKPEVRGNNLNLIEGLYSYDPTCNKLNDHYNTMKWMSVDTYVESLVSLASFSDKGIKEDDETTVIVG